MSNSRQYTAARADCEADITDVPLTHDCPQRRARMVSNAMEWARAESHYMFAWGVIVVVCGVTAIYTAHKAQPLKCGMLLALAIFAATRSHVCEKESVRWADKALEIAKRERE